MTPQILARCPHCKETGTLEIKKGSLACPFCQKEWGEIQDSADPLNRCPVCQCRQFYLSKNFNQFLGCLIVFAGIILVPWTFGLSLPVFALIDWIIYKRVPTIIICYQCAAEFHNLSTDRRLKPFMHHIGLKYDKYR